MATRGINSSLAWPCSSSRVRAHHQQRGLPVDGARPARAALQRCAEFHEGSAPFALVDPRYDGMRQTPEFQSLLARVKR